MDRALADGRVGRHTWRSEALDLLGCPYPEIARLVCGGDGAADAGGVSAGERPRGWRPSAGSPWVVLGLAAWLALNPTRGSPTTLFDGAFVVDGFSRFLKLLTLGASAVALLLSFDYMRETKTLKFEYPVLVLLATAGMLMMISANDLISLYLGARAAEPGALRGGGFSPRRPPLQRGGAQVFRTRRPFLGDVALWRFPDLRLHRIDQLHRHSRRRCAGAAPARTSA